MLTVNLSKGEFKRFTNSSLKLISGEKIVPRRARDSFLLAIVKIGGNQFAAPAICSEKRGKRKNNVFRNCNDSVQGIITDGVSNDHRLLYQPKGARNRQDHRDSVRSGSSFQCVLLSKYCRGVSRTPAVQHSFSLAMIKMARE